VLIATSSDVRADMIHKIIGQNKVRNLLLEKVLFQKEEDYFEIQELLKTENIPAWVNFYRRGTKFFTDLKNQMNLSEKIEISVRGSLWGIGCLGTHFIDLLYFLSDCCDFEFRESLLDKNILDSKRKGFKEFTGVLKGENSRGDSLTLECKDHGSDPWIIHVNNGKERHKIFEEIGGANYEYFDGKEEIRQRVDILMQSQRTHFSVKQIIHENTCDLTNFDNSVSIHLPLIRVLLKGTSKNRAKSWMMN
jgi:hypothetical protein